MNAIFFGLKRAFHGTLRLTRAGLARIGLTAARFDLLYLLERRRAQRLVVPATQSEIWRTLGVTPPVVSKMLKSLESLGLVRRERAWDKRQRLVRLTAAGRARIQNAMRRYIHSGYAQLAVDSALAGDQWADPSACLFAMSDLESHLNATRRAFGDFASLAYPWHPDD